MTLDRLLGGSWPMHRGASDRGYTSLLARQGRQAWTDADVAALRRRVARFRPAETLELVPPARLQRSRRRGYRLPPGARYVGRPSRWGNPYRVDAGAEAYGSDARPPRYTRVEAVRLFRLYATDTRRPDGWLEPLRGRDLVCWCPIGTPCHADVLLELANR